MYNRDNQPWYEAIPFGPLTEDIFNRLALSLYDESKWDMQKIAEERGIRAGEYMALSLKKIRQSKERSANKVSENITDVENV